MLTGGEIMVKCLEAEGVDILFGYPGAAICPFYDALYDSPIRHVLVRSEQNAAHMASGYARARRSSSRRSSRLAETPPAAAKVLAPVISAALKKFSVRQETTAFR